MSVLRILFLAPVFASSLTPAGATATATATAARETTGTAHPAAARHHDAGERNVAGRGGIALPEPADLGLFAAGVAGLVIGRRGFAKRRDDKAGENAE